MILTRVDEFEVALDLIAPFAPVLEASPENPKFAVEMAKLGHFTFRLEQNPSVPAQYSHGVSFIRKALVARPVIGNVIYAMADGAANKVTAKDVETYIDCHIEYVPAFDLTMISSDLGIQQWGLLKINHDANDILCELPGPISQQIIAIGKLEEETKRHLKQWYFRMTDLLWGLR